jgi:hypothetical protein
LKELQIVPKKIILISPPLLTFKWITGFIRLFFFPAFYEQVSIKNNNQFLERFIQSIKSHRYVQNEYRGIFVSSSDHDLMLKKYSEIEYNRDFSPEYRKFLFLSLGNLFRGVIFPKESEILQVILENDPTTIDYPGVQKKIVLKNSGHSSFGYQPDLLKEVVEFLRL